MSQSRAGNAELPADGPSAQEFVAALEAIEPTRGRIPMREVFALAKRFVAMDSADIEKLLESEDHLARVGAVSIMGQQATRKSTSDARRKELFELYLRRTDRIDTWDLVDVSAHHVVGGYWPTRTERSSIGWPARKAGGRGGSRCSRRSISSEGRAR